MSYDRGRAETQATLAAGLQSKPSFAFVKTPAWEVAVEAGAKAALAKIIAQLGAAIVETDIPAMAGIVQHHANVHLGEMASFYGPLQKKNPEAISAKLTERLAAGAKVLAGDYVTSLWARDRIYGEVARVLDRHTALITLPSTGPAPKGLTRRQRHLQRHVHVSRRALRDGAADDGGRHAVRRAAGRQAPRRGAVARGGEVARGQRQAGERLSSTSPSPHRLHSDGERVGVRGRNTARASGCPSP